MNDTENSKNELPFIDKFFEQESEPELFDQPSAEIKYPSMYRVVLLNDDFTPMDFVILVLKRFFHKSHEEAIKIMLETHGDGEGLCGVFTRDVAETKVIQVIDFARDNNYPLKCILHKQYAASRQ